MKILICALTLAGCCSAALVKTELDEPSVKTIGMMTGKSADDKLYASAFRKGAVKACLGPYTIIERSRTPWTLDGYAVDPTYFYWVITCGDRGESQETFD